MTTIFGKAALAAALLALAGTSLAQPVQVEGAWARPTVPGQQAGGAFMTLTASQPTQLLGASSSAAAVVEVHEMRMEGDVMRMRAIDSLALPAGTPVQLRPGGHHLMLMGLKAPLVVGASVPLTLRLKDGQGRETQLAVQVPVRAAAPAAGAAGAQAPATHHAH